MDGSFHKHVEGREILLDHAHVYTTPAPPKAEESEARTATVLALGRNEAGRRTDKNTRSLSATFFSSSPTYHLRISYIVPLFASISQQHSSIELFNTSSSRLHTPSCLPASLCRPSRQHLSSCPILHTPHKPPTNSSHDARTRPPRRYALAKLFINPSAPSPICGPESHQLPTSYGLRQGRLLLHCCNRQGQLHGLWLGKLERLQAMPSN